MTKKAKSPKPQLCQWFLNCDHVAVRWQSHPILGGVHICQRCSDKLAFIDAQLAAKPL